MNKEQQTFHYRKWKPQSASFFCW